MTNQTQKVDIFLVGAPKCASTWIHRCFQEHEEIYVPEEDSIKYYDLNYHKGDCWYKNYFNNATNKQIIVDPTPSYFRSPGAISRIASEHPDAKFILSLRNPLDRAFSQYWHEKKRGIITVNFEEALQQVMLWGWFIETGFYATHLDNLLKYFPKDRIHITLFDDLKNDAGLFIKNIFEFVDVDNTFEPLIINKPVNKAGVSENITIKTITSLSKVGVVGRALNPLRKVMKKFGVRERLMETFSNRNEYEEGVSEAMRKELLSIYLPEIERLESMIDKDLSNWKQ